MTLDEIIMDEGLKAKLRSLISEGRVPHAMMLSEVDGTGAFAIVQAFLSEFFAPSESHLLSKMMHPDVYYLFPIAASDEYKGSDVTCDNFFQTFSSTLLANPYIKTQKLYEKMGIKGAPIVTVKETEKIIERLDYFPIRADKKVVVILLPEYIHVQAANKLLKSVEEPPENTYFIFITHDEEKVIKTIASRCARYQVPALSTQAERIVRQRYFAASGKASEAENFFSYASKIFSSLVKKDLEEALAAVELLDEITNKEDRKAFLAYLSLVLRNIFLLQQGLGSLADIEPAERPYWEGVAPKLKKTFARRALSEVSAAGKYLERNVGYSMTMCDLVLKFYCFV